MHAYAKHIAQKGRIPKNGPPPSVDLVHGPLYGPVHGLPQWNALIVEDEFYQRSKRILGTLNG